MGRQKELSTDYADFRGFGNQELEGRKFLNLSGTQEIRKREDKGNLLLCIFPELFSFPSSSLGTPVSSRLQPRKRGHALDALFDGSIFEAGASKTSALPGWSLVTRIKISQSIWNSGTQEKYRTKVGFILSPEFLSSRFSCAFTFAPLRLCVRLQQPTIGKVCAHRAFRLPPGIFPPAPPRCRVRLRAWFAATGFRLRGVP